MQLETIAEINTVTEALLLLREKGYSELSEINATDSNAIEQAERWDKKLNLINNLLQKVKP